MGHAILIVKIVAAVVLFLALVMGGIAHFSSAWTATMKTIPGQKMCKERQDTESFTRRSVKGNGQIVIVENKGTGTGVIADCPFSAIPMEIVFIVLTTLGLILAIVLIILGFLKGGEGIWRIVDAACSAVIGIFCMIAGILLLAAACMIDTYRGKGKDENVVKIFREGDYYYLKLVAGIIALIAGIIYFVACFLIFRSKGSATAPDNNAAEKDAVQNQDQDKNDEEKVKPLKKKVPK